MGLNIPQQIKVSHVAAPVTASLSLHRFNSMQLGYREVAILLAAKFWQYQTAGAVKSSYIWLSRKSDFIPDESTIDGEWQDESYLLDYFFTRNDDSVNGYAGETQYVNYPFPFILIRPPSLLIYGTANANWAGCSLFYLQEEVSEQEMAQLMVKDHD